MSDDFQEEGSVTIRQNLEEVLKAVSDFINGPAYIYYVNARKTEIAQKRADIVSIDPIDRVAEIECFKMRGDLRTTEEFLTLFEDMVVNLGDRIEQLLDLEQPTDHSTNERNENEQE